MNCSKKTKKIIAVLVVALFAAALVLCALGLGGAAPGFDSDLSFDNAPLRYSQQLSERFFATMMLFFNGEPGEFAPFDELAAGLYNAFSAARIPSEKVSWFLDRVEEVPVDENPMHLFLLERMARYEALMKEFEEGNRETPPRFSEIVSMDEMRLGVSATMTFLVGSPLSHDELGRFFYRLSLNYTEGTEYGELLKLITEKEFTTLTVGSYAVYVSASELSNATSLAGARTVGQSLTALGSSYLNLIRRIGLKNVDKLFGFNYRLNEESPENGLSAESAKEYNQVLADAEGAPSGAILLLGNVLTELSQTVFEELYLAEESLTGGDEQAYRAHRVFAAAEIARAVRTGLDRAKESSERLYETDTEAVNLLSRGYVASYRMNDILNELEAEKRQDYAAILERTKKGLNDMLDAADALNGSGSYAEFYRMAESDPVLFAGYEEKARLLYGVASEDTSQVTDVVIGVIYNLAVRAMSGLL